MRSVTAIFGTSEHRYYYYFIPADDLPEVGDLIITSAKGMPDDPGGQSAYSSRKIVDDVCLGKIIGIEDGGHRILHGCLLDRPLPWRLPWPYCIRQSKTRTP